MKILNLLVNFVFGCRTVSGVFFCLLIIPKKSILRDFFVKNLIGFIFYDQTDFRNLFSVFNHYFFFCNFELIYLEII